MRQAEVDATAIEVIKRDALFNHRIVDICRDAWERRHPRH